MHQTELHLRKLYEISDAWSYEPENRRSLGLWGVVAWFNYSTDTICVYSDSRAEKTAITYSGNSSRYVTTSMKGKERYEDQHSNHSTPRCRIV